MNTKQVGHHRAYCCSQAVLTCSTEKYDGRHSHKKHGFSAQYAVDCCQGKFISFSTPFGDNKGHETRYVNLRIVYHILH